MTNIMPTLDLSGTWQIHPDPLSQGLSDSWWVRPPSDDWREIRVPSAWQTVLGVEAVGLAWYHRKLPDEVLAWAGAGLQVRLCFDAVATDCRVWVAGHEVGRHLGDWLPFEIDITAALRGLSAAPEIYVRVDQYHAPRPPKGVVVENGHVAKGFHDVLSIQHAGLWDRVGVRAGGAATLAPLGLGILVDPETGAVQITAESSGDGDLPPARLVILDPDGHEVARGVCRIDGREWRGTAKVPAKPALWSPDTPLLYRLVFELGDGPTAERFEQRFGFRTVATGGPKNSQILLNGSPLQIRGILHWGHEPRHLAPAPPPEQVRDEFQHLRALGFNCVCLCMFYPPDYYFDIADETGMLIWQEHPIWKSRMTPDLLPEYRRCFEGFLRRDRRHPSVIIVSATCEHEAFDAELGRWWWRRSGELLPRTLRQLQTGFLEQTPPDQTDLYDDHVYDNCGRWANFHADMHERIGELPPRPFVMGETIISNAWPDIEAFRKTLDDQKPWWLTHGLDECALFEGALTRRSGAAVLERFKAQGERFRKDFRKRQAEVLRMFPRNAGFVTNSIRDVPICRVGFMDDLNRWRFTPEDTHAWLSDAVLLLKTPDHYRAFPAGATIECELGLSNFGRTSFDGPVLLRTPSGEQRIRLKAAPGEIVWSNFRFTIPAGAELKRFEIEASADGLPSNHWTLVAIPTATPLMGISRLDGLPFTAAESEPEFEEHAYSSGWCLACRSWKPRLPELAGWLPNARPVSASEPIPADTSVLVAHRLTRQVHDFIRRGGRCVLCAHRHTGGLGTKWINLWGQLPLIAESAADVAPLRNGESDTLLELLPYDLTRWTTRAIPTDDLGDSFRDHVEPIIRYVWTHDAGVPKCFDAVCSARVEQGLLVVTCLDHSSVAGAWLLQRLIQYAAQTPLPPAERELDLAPFVAKGM